MSNAPSKVSASLNDGTFAVRIPVAVTCACDACGDLVTDPDDTLCTKCRARVRSKAPRLVPVVGLDGEREWESAEVAS